MKVLIADDHTITKLKDELQAFIVYPLVEESEKLDLKAAETYYNDLKECREISYSDWEKISKWRKLGYTIARLLSYFL